MSVKQLISDYAAFNEWANERIVTWLRRHDAELLYTESPSSFKRIDLTLQHMLRPQQFWLAFISEREHSHGKWSSKKGEGETYMRELLSVSTDMKVKFSAYSEADLKKKLHLDMPWARNSLSRYEYMLHVVNHSTFHRGQLITMGRCLGMARGIVNTDYNIYRTLQQSAQ